MSNNNNQNNNPYDLFQIEQNGDGTIKLALLEAYHEAGVDSDLPEVITIPGEIDGQEVTALADEMFKNNTKIKEIILPDSVESIPHDFCNSATNLRVVRNTGHIKYIGGAAFACTRIREAVFPNLETLDMKSVTREETQETVQVGMAFAGCAYLEAVDIGKVTSIPERTFYGCAWLREVNWNGTEVAIGSRAFAQTRSLRELPWLAHATSIADNAFFYSRISTPLLTDNGTVSGVFPMGDNETNFWSGVGFTPCRNPLKTKLSQNYSEWKEVQFLESSSSQDNDPEVIKYPYGNACAIFAVMHIHSAITGKSYEHPSEFVAELYAEELSKYVYTDNWPGNITKVPEMFEDLGYRTKVYANTANITREAYQELVNALAEGAYIYSQAARTNDPSGGHAVVIYGINDLGEVCVLDSDVLHEAFREGGFERYGDIYTYTIPYQNIMDDNSAFIIVYPPEKEPVVDWTGYATVNTFTSDSKPSDYPENQVTISYVANDEGTPVSKQGILTAYRVGNSAFRTFMPKTKAALYLQIKPADAARDEWLEWTECNHQDFTRVGNNTISLQMMPDDLPTGVNICGVTAGAFPEDTKGYLTTYKLFSSFPNAREEWQPNGSMNKYVRHATSTGAWSDWYTITPSFTVDMEETDGENQYEPNMTVEKILAAINAGATVRCDISVDGVRYLLPLASVHSADDQMVLTYGLNMGNTQVTVIQTGNTATASVTAQAE